jgi:hypothetical protein
MKLDCVQLYEGYLTTECLKLVEHPNSFNPVVILVWLAGHVSCILKVGDKD